MFSSRHPSPFFRESVAIIGGGISGLSMGYRLARQGHRVTVFEASAQPGGNAASFELDGRPVARVPEIIRPTDSPLIQLIEELGLQSELNWRPLKSAQLRDGRCYAMNRPRDLLKLSPLSLASRLRALGAAKLLKMKSSKGLDNITAATWIKGLTGAAAFESWWQPQLLADYGEAWAEVPALPIWTAMRADVKSPLQGHLRGGCRIMALLLAERIRILGSSVRLGCQVQCVDLDERQRPLILSPAGIENFDQAVLTGPVSHIPSLSGPRLRRRLPDLSHECNGLLCAAVILPRPVMHVDCLLTPEAHYPFDGIHSGDAQNQADGIHRGQILYLTRFLHRSHPDFQQSDQTIRTNYLSALGEIFPAIDRAATSIRLFKNAAARPLLRTGQLPRRHPETIIPGGIYFAGTAQTYPEAPGCNSAIIQAARTLKAMEYARRLHAPGTTPFSLPH